jgi:hypothetical protein
MAKVPKIKNPLKIRSNQRIKNLLKSQKALVSQAHLNQAKVALEKINQKKMTQVKAKKDNCPMWKKVIR